MGVLRRLAAVLPITLVVAAAACGKDDDEAVLDPVTLAMLPNTDAVYDDGQEKIFEVQKQVPLPYRRFTGDEAPKGKDEPYGRPPFHTVSNSKVTIRFTLTNLDPDPHTVDLLIDPWNEFVRYEPGVTMVRDDEVQPNFSGIQRTFVVGPKSRVEGIITPDDMIELAVDLTTAMALKKNPPDPMGQFAGAVLYNRAFNAQNRSSEPDVVLAPYIPRQSRDLLAAITGFDLGIRTQADESATSAAKLEVELIIDVEDDSPDGDRIVIAGDEGDGDDKGKALGRPGNVLTPPATAPEE